MPGCDTTTRQLYCHSCHSTSLMPLLLALGTIRYSMASMCALKHYTAIENMPGCGLATRRLHCHSCHITRGVPLLLAHSQNRILLRALNASDMKFAVCFTFAGLLSTSLSLSSKLKLSKFSGFSNLFSQVCRRLP